MILRWRQKGPRLVSTCMPNLQGLCCCETPPPMDPPVASSVVACCSATSSELACCSATSSVVVYCSATRSRARRLRLVRQDGGRLAQPPSEPRSSPHARRKHELETAPPSCCSPRLRPCRRAGTPQRCSRHRSRRRLRRPRGAATNACCRCAAALAGAAAGHGRRPCLGPEGCTGRGAENCCRLPAQASRPPPTAPPPLAPCGLRRRLR